MKKVLFAAILSLPVLFACNKGDNDGSSEPIKLDTPKAAAAAMTVTPKAKTDLPVITVKKNSTDQKTVAVKKVEFFRSGRYLIESVPVEQPSIAAFTKAATSSIYFSGTYTANGGEYNLSGDFSGKMNLGDGTLTIDGNEYEVTTNPAGVTEGGLDDFATRTWKISIIDLEISQKHQTVVCSGSKNVSECVKVIKQWGFTIDESVADYDVNEITLNPSAVMLTFANGKTYGGSFDIAINTGNFTYDFAGNAEMDGKFIDVTAKGNVSEDDKGRLVVTVKAKAGERSGSLTIYCTEAK